MATSTQLTSAGLRRVANAACTGSALDLGATVIGWRPQSEREVLFLSRDAHVATGDEIHGGVPLCAPWFGHGRDDAEVPHPHGLVRWVPWRLVEQRESEGSTSLVWELSGSEIAHLPGAANYPSDIQFRYEVRFAEVLTCTLRTGSPSTSFVLDQVFHSYFSVSRIEDVVISGLGGRYRDYTEDAAWHDSSGELRITGHTDRIYDGADVIRIRDAERELMVRSDGASSTVVWNPGPEGAQSLIGWAAEEWETMVCVEVGNVQHNAVTVPAGGTHTLSMTIELHRCSESTREGL